MTATSEPTEPTYFKSPRSGGDGNCVEVSFDRLESEGVVLLRHSKHPERAPFRFTRGEWEAFTGGAADGAFNLPST